MYRLEREAERRLQAFNSLWQKTVQSLRQLEQLSAGEHTRKEAGNRYQQVVQMLGISAETRLLDPSTCPDERQVQIGAYRLANGQEIPSHTRCLLTGSEWKEVQALLQQTRAIAELRTF
ncbi:MAG: hypothetical protein D6736_07660 [Nitrospinota bacterium]|nr:MAG: hypothetical protein D6736_07660 [Nitrospinota bacterium]